MLKRIISLPYFVAKYLLFLENNMSFSSLRSAINTKLLTLTGSGQPLACVYPYHHLGVSGYPAATFEPSSMEAQISTTSENMREYTFDIVVSQELSLLSRDDALTTLCNASDAIIDMLDSDYTLSGACDISRALPAEFGEIVGEDGAILYARLQLKCSILSHI